MNDRNQLDLLKSIDKLEEHRDIYIAKGESPELINRLDEIINYHYGVANMHGTDDMTPESENDKEVGKIVVHNGKIYRSYDY